MPKIDMFWSCRKWKIYCIALVVSAVASAGELDLKKLEPGAMLNAVLGQIPLKVEIANNDVMHERGLMFRKALAADSGMLFVYTESRPLIFWMKNTEIALSIGFFDEKGILLEVQDMLPAAKGLPDEKLQRYVSGRPARYALEMALGWFSQHKIKVGMKLKIKK